MAQDNAITTLMGFDFGSKSIGVAIAQVVTGTAAPLEALAARDGIPDWEKISAMLDEWQPEQLIVGLPLNMDGSGQDVTLAAKKFANRLHGRFGKQVALHDERLTTAEAKQKLFELGGYRKLQKGKIDSVSACLITESWLAQYYHGE